MKNVIFIFIAVLSTNLVVGQVTFQDVVDEITNVNADIEMYITNVKQNFTGILVARQGEVEALFNQYNVLIQELKKQGPNGVKLANQLQNAFNQLLLAVNPLVEASKIENLLNRLFTFVDVLQNEVKSVIIQNLQLAQSNPAFINCWESNKIEIFNAYLEMKSQIEEEIGTQVNTILEQWKIVQNLVAREYTSYYTLCSRIAR